MDDKLGLGPSSRLMNVGLTIQQRTILFPALTRVFYAFFCPGMMTTHAESINLDLQRGLDRRLRHTTLNTEQNQLAIIISAGN